MKQGLPGSGSGNYDPNDKAPWEGDWGDMYTALLTHRDMESVLNTIQKPEPADGHAGAEGKRSSGRPRCQTWHHRTERGMVGEGREERERGRGRWQWRGDEATKRRGPSPLHVIETPPRFGARGREGRGERGEGSDHDQPTKKARNRERENS